MSILIAESAGFCSGVRFAVNKALQTATLSKTPIYCLGDIIHNKDVMSILKEKGIVTVESIDEITESGATVLIRAHGVGKNIYEILKEKGFTVVDATCGYVRKIHKLAEQSHKDGAGIIIIGDRNHPEVVGIDGWCENTAFILESEDEIPLIPYAPDENIAVYVQTTFDQHKYRKIIDKIKISFQNLHEFDTICKSTLRRQFEAAELSTKCDIMVVLGDDRSSNTKKIYEICRMNCPETYLAENLAKLPRGLDIKNKTVGITAGASTPANVIEEVYTHMSETAARENEISFEDMINQTSTKLSSGTIVKGRIIGKSDTELYVDVAYKSDGILSVEELSEDDELTALNTGDEIEVYVTRVNDSEGNVLLSKRRVDSIRSKDTVLKAFEEKTPLKVKVRSAVKGGVIALYKGFEIFIPASQVSGSYIKDLNETVGASLDIIVTEFDLRKKRVIGSAKILIDRDKESKMSGFWDEIEVGKQYEGTMKSFVEFGAFVNIGPVDGLLHISEMSWGQLRHPTEIFKAGQKIQVYIISFDKEKKKISLGFKKEEDNPWHNISEKVATGDEVDVRIVRIVPFGAFAEITPGVEGLIHISNISDKRIGHPAEVLRIDDVVRVKVLDVDPVAKRIALSIKELAAIVNETPDSDEATEHTENLNVSLGDVVDFDIKE